MLHFLNRCSIFCFLDNHDYNFSKSFECIAGAGVMRSLISDESTSLREIDQFQKEANDWVFGHISYDEKNNIEDLQSSNPDGIQFPGIVFFAPQIVFILSDKELQIGVRDSTDTAKVFEEITSLNPVNPGRSEVPILKSRFTKEEYTETVKKLLKHLLRGDCYEINFCQEFYAAGVNIDPIQVYLKLCKLSPNPFSAFYKFEDKFLICASPERFLKKTGNIIISQPMKGTARRIKDDPKADDQLKADLIINEKERSENIIIVDLVRNDLSKICTEGSIIVKDFLSVYSFPQVHQMISTISGILKENISIADIFDAAFPMGSMTGAPKKRVMQIIEKYERTKRGLFSGSVGYINPDGDFDFNVVIRSLLYNKKNKYLSIQAGSAITFKSDPENEYEECLLKVSALKEALQ